MSRETTIETTYSISSLESGIKYHDLRETPSDPLLIEAIDASPEQLAAISQHFEIDLDDLQDVKDLDERPRLQFEDKYTMIVLRVPVNLMVLEREYSTNPIGIFTNGRDLIILKNFEIPLKKERLRRKIKQSTTAAEVIYRMWEIVISSFEHTLDIIEATINNIEDNILTELYPSQLDRFFQLSRDAVFMEAALKSNMKVLRKLIRTQRIGKMVLDTDRLQELEVDLQQQMELSAIYRDLIDNAMNAYDSIVSHNLNQVMKVLTSVSLLVSVPTLISGYIGMNVEIPFSREDPLAFFYVIILSLFISLPILIYLRRKNLL